MKFKLNDYVVAKYPDNKETLRYHTVLTKDKFIKDSFLGIQKGKYVYKIIGINNCSLLGLESYYLTDGRSILECRVPDFLEYQAYETTIKDITEILSD